MNNYLLYLIVFISGGGVLSLEILGTRILGPFYGVSIFLWSALISITLIALSAGYFLGGRLADKKTDLNIFSSIIALAGIWILLIPMLRDPVLNFSEGFDLRWAVLVSSFILFVPPLTLMGMVSPYAVKLKVSSLDNVGKSAGDLYAVSTIGSVISALLTGYILIPNVGVNILTLSIGIVLLFAASLGYIIKRKVLHKVVIILLLLILSSLAYSFTPNIKKDPEKGLLWIKQSAYAEVRVVETDESRFLLIDGGVHSVVNAKTLENKHRYVWILDLAKNFFDHEGDMLLIGLGGGSVLKSYYNDNWDVEAVEIDPVVTEAAYNYFDLDSSWTTVHHKDGREFLLTTDKKFDLILLDAFGSSSVPFHLITKESFAITKEGLKENGILGMNLESLGWDDIIVLSTAATLKQVFKYVEVFPIGEPPDKLDNIIIYASDEEFNLKKDIIRNYFDPDYRFSANYERAHAWDNRFSPDISGIPVLTDDLNPVDIWSERINYESRKNLHKYFSEKGLAW